MSIEVTTSRMGNALPMHDMTDGASIDPPSLTLNRVIYRNSAIEVRALGASPRGHINET